MMQSRRIVVLLLVIGCGVLIGCETDMVWVRPPGLTDEDVRRDAYECSREAQMLPYRPPRTGDDALYEAMLDVEHRKQMRNACLEARGYRQRPRR